MEQLNYWSKCRAELSSGPESLLSQERARMIHLNIEDSSQLQTSLFQLRLRKSALLKACFSSAFVIVAAILVGLLIASMNYAFTSWAVEKTAGRLEEYHRHFLKTGSNSTIAMHLRKLTAEPHVAGTPENFATADYVLSTFKRHGLDAHYSDYNVLLTYPLTRSLVLSLQGNRSIQFPLKEKTLEGDPYTKSSKAIPAFHAYSPSGDAAAEMVYVNYGRVEDFARLAEMGINASGAIVIARHGMIFRGDIVKNSAKAGAVAVITYSDPQDYAANDTQGNYPESKWLPSSGIQRGTVFEDSGDPLTPGWPSTLDSERLSSEYLKSVLPSIPSLPISADEALVIMRSMGGPVAPSHWHGNLNLPAYRVGPGPGILNLTYLANQTIAPIRNVFAVIKGSEEPDRYVLLGNHRDAWTFGAVDPNSGTATLLDIAGRFGKLLKQGWKPRRTIILCSWDAEEYGSVGSTEWVEENYDLLYSRAVAYINVDCAVAGPDFFASATPQLDNLLIEATKKVADPEDSSRTVYQSWIASANAKSDTMQHQIGRLGGGGSDFASFLHHVGVPAIDIYFGKDYPVYHSLYDNYMWMEKFGDPLFHRHVAVAGIWGIIALRLADEVILPFSYAKYADELQTYTSTLEAQLKDVAAPPHMTTSPLRQSITKLRSAALGIIKQQKEFQTFGSKVRDLQYLLTQRRSFNDRLLMAERAFTQSDGLPGRPWYKHLIYGPTRHNDYGSTSFPGVSDALQHAVSMNSSENWSTALHEIWRVSRAIERVARVLYGELA
eukprot:Gb_09577 [translate_table: standard]